MSQRFGCEAIQQSDQKYCNRCGYVWDMNDVDPPTCKTERQIIHDHSIEKLNEIRKELK